MTSKELEDSGFKMYVGLINPDEGLDASGEFTDDRFQSTITSKYGRLYIPTIFNNNGVISDRDEKQIMKNAREVATKEANTKGWATDAVIRGIEKRKNMANVKGDILMAPIPKEMMSKIKSGNPIDSAILLTRMATHIIEGSEISRISPEDKEDIIEDLKLSKEKIERRKKRATRRSKD
jgi:hypothetical protein